MAFGSNLVYTVGKKLLAEGEHFAEIKNICEKETNGKQYLSVSVEVEGKEDYEPKIFNLFDVDPFDSLEMQKATLYRISRFCDATGAEIIDGKMIYEKIVGHRVKIHVQKQKNGFIGIHHLSAATEKVEADYAARNAKAAAGVKSDIPMF